MANHRSPASNENPAVSVISQVLVMGTTLEVFLYHSRTSGITLATDAGGHTF